MIKITDSYLSSWLASRSFVFSSRSIGERRWPLASGPKLTSVTEATEANGLQGRISLDQLRSHGVKFYHNSSMPTYWERDNDSRPDASLELGQQPFAAVGARSAMCGMIVKVTLIAFGLVASYYGSIATTVPRPSQQGLEVAAAAIPTTDPPRKSNEPQQAFRTKPVPTAPGMMNTDILWTFVLTFVLTLS